MQCTVMTLGKGLGHPNQIISCPRSVSIYVQVYAKSFYQFRQPRLCLPFITLFSPSSDIQGVRGGPSPCMPYKLQIWYSDGSLVRLFTSFIHISCILKAITKQLYTTTKVPFSLHFNSFLIDFVLV